MFKSTHGWSAEIFVCKAYAEIILILTEVEAKEIIGK